MRTSRERVKVPWELRHFQALVTKAAELGWPTSYMSDLQVHDRDALQGYPADWPFGWGIWAGGTHLLLPMLGGAPTERQLLDLAEHPMQLERALGPCRWFYWDGVALHSARTAEVLSTWLQLGAKYPL